MITLKYPSKKIVYFKLYITSEATLFPFFFERQVTQHFFVV